MSLKFIEQRGQERLWMRYLMIGVNRKITSYLIWSARKITPSIRALPNQNLFLKSLPLPSGFFRYWYTRTLDVVVKPLRAMGSGSCSYVC